MMDYVTRPWSSKILSISLAYLKIENFLTSQINYFSSPWTFQFHAWSKFLQQFIYNDMHENILMKFKNWWENWAYICEFLYVKIFYGRGEVKNSYWQSVELVKLVKYWIWKFCWRERESWKSCWILRGLISCWDITELFFKFLKWLKIFTIFMF